MSAASEARKQFAKEQELEKLRAKKAAQDANMAALSPEQRASIQKRSKKFSIGCMGVVVIFIAIIVIAVIGGSHNSGSSNGGTSASSSNFTGTVGAINVINPASVNVQFSFTNNGTSAGIPNCTVKVQDPSNAYSGFDSPAITNPVAPGATVSGNMNIIVTGQGASYVTQGDVTCS